jgi:hypothetical protein
MGNLLEMLRVELLVCQWDWGKMPWTGGELWGIESTAGVLESVLDALSGHGLASL